MRQEGTVSQQVFVIESGLTRDGAAFQRYVYQRFSPSFPLFFVFRRGQSVACKLQKLIVPSGRGGWIASVVKTSVITKAATLNKEALWSFVFVHASLVPLSCSSNVWLRSRWQQRAAWRKMRGVIAHRTC